ncbi:MAG: hypothetical protein FWG73_06690 [Planctomycetaceae bacterium]|nr:hypothetical protein [Planctomycetaceae bacterium]
MPAVSKITDTVDLFVNPEKRHSGESIVILAKASSFRRRPEPRGIDIARNAWIPACAGMTVLTQ